MSTEMGLASSRLVIFDLDGTVVDSLPATFKCFAEAVAPVLGRFPDKREILARMGAADQHIIAEWVGERHSDEAVRRLYACYQREFASLTPFPGIVEAIHDLRAVGRLTGLFTGRGRPSTDVMLRAMGIGTLFDTSVTGDEVVSSKPDPDGLLVVTGRLSILPSDTVYVGDSPLDVRAALSAGVTPVAALWGTHQREEMEAFEGLTMAETVEELRTLLGL
jgi:HAD superfamily hydrolase (TIGR01509 family)